MVAKNPPKYCPKCGSPLVKGHQKHAYYGCENPDCYVYHVIYTSQGAITEIVYATVL